MGSITLSSATADRVKGILKKAPYLQPPIVSGWTERPRLYLHRDEPWLLVPAESDPLRTTSGGAVIPTHALADLQRVVEAKVEFDRIAIAHEIEPGRVPVDLRSALGPQGLPCSHDVAKKLVGVSPPPTARNLRLAAGLDKCVAALTGAASTLAGAAMNLSLDPIVFGVISCSDELRESEPALYFPLTAWRW